MAESLGQNQKKMVISDLDLEQLLKKFSIFSLQNEGYGQKDL